MVHFTQGVVYRLGHRLATIGTKLKLTVSQWDKFSSLLYRRMVFQNVHPSPGANTAV